jgi:hypothetical protein
VNGKDVLQLPAQTGDLTLIGFLPFFAGLICTSGKIHLVENSLFLLALKNVLSLLQILSSRNMTFLSCSRSCQCVRYHLNHNYNSSNFLW